MFPTGDARYTDPEVYECIHATLTGDRSAIGRFVDFATPSGGDMPLLIHYYRVTRAKPSEKKILKLTQINAQNCLSTGFNAILTHFNARL